MKALIVKELMSESNDNQLEEKLTELPGMTFNGMQIESADNFSYNDPVDGSKSLSQGIRIFFSSGERLVLRLSGTGTEGATLRVYLDCFENDTSLIEQDTQEALAPLIMAANELAGIQQFTGRKAPDVIT